MSSQVTNPRAPSLIEHDGWRFLIVDSPTEATLAEAVKTMQKYNVKHLVRVCLEHFYPDEALLKAGIEPHEWSFPDGEPPPQEVIDKWLTLAHTVFDKQGGAARKEAIAVHCVAGLGRAPVLVALALIEKGMDALDAVQFIRERRRGAINRPQLQFLEKYKPRRDCIML